MKTTISLVLLAIILALAYAAIQTSEQKKATINTNIVIDDVDRIFTLTNPALVKETTTITAVNAGTSSVDVLHLALPRDVVEKNLALLRVTLTNKQSDLTSKGFENKANKDAVFFEVPLGKSVAAQEKVSLTIDVVYLRSLSPYPKEIKQRDSQRVLYVGSAYFYSPYSVRTQKSTFRLGTAVVESFTEVKPSDRRGDVVIYGSYSDQKAFSSKEIRIHFQNNNAFIVATSVERIIEISHWGNLAVEEHYEIKHAGGKLKGHFSRMEYLRGQVASSPSVVRAITAKLPREAADIYYRDRIGNISTSDCRASGNHLEVDFTPRFPLFGGWKTKFYTGWNLPLGKNLTTSGDKYTLSASFGIPFDFIPIDDLTVKIIVPEGAADIQVSVPFEVDSESRDTMKTYLDTYGRSVIILNKKNVVPEHNVVFQVTYNFNSLSIYQEPLLVIGGLLAFCFTVMFYVRLDLTIAKTEPELKRESETRVVEIVESYIDKHAERDNLYARIIYSLNKYIENKTVDKELKEIKKERQTIRDNIKETVIGQLNKVDAKEFMNKVSTIEKREEEKFAALEQIISVRKEGGSEESMKKKIAPVEKEYDTKTEEINDLISSLNI